MDVSLNGEQLTLRREHYLNGRTALVLSDGTRCTVNVPDFPLAPDEVLIKDYSENAGVFDALVRAGAIAPTGRTLGVGYAEVHIARLL